MEACSRDVSVERKGRNGRPPSPTIGMFGERASGREKVDSFETIEAIGRTLGKLPLTKGPIEVTGPGIMVLAQCQPAGSRQVNVSVRFFPTETDTRKYLIGASFFAFTPEMERHLPSLGIPLEDHGDFLEIKFSNLREEADYHLGLVPPPAVPAI